jgi:hypothetical protein
MPRYGNTRFRQSPNLTSVILTFLADTSRCYEDKVLLTEAGRLSTLRGQKTAPQSNLGEYQIGLSVNLTESTEDSEAYNKNSRHKQPTLLSENKTLDVEDSVCVALFVQWKRVI